LKKIGIKAVLTSGRLLAFQNFYEKVQGDSKDIDPKIRKELEEQQAIGAYFSNLDNLINSHQEKISQLEILKKKLLQDMFI